MLGEYSDDIQPTAEADERDAKKENSAHSFTEGAKVADALDKAIGDMTGEKDKVSEEEGAKKEREAFLNDPEQQQGALALAGSIIDAMGEGRWFTLTNICKKMQIDRVQAINKLKMIQLFGHATVRVGDHTDKSKHRGEPLWTIALSPESKLKAIDGIIEETLAHIANLNRLYLHRKIWLKEIANSKKADPIN